MSRLLTVAPSAAERLSVVFEPTPELRAELSSSRGWHQLLGWIGVGVGVAGLAGSAAYQFGYLNAERAAAKREYDDLNSQADTKTGCFQQPAGCQRAIDAAHARLQQADSLTALGVSGLIFSGLVLGAGVVSLVTSPNLAKYDQRPAGGDYLQELGVAPLPGGGAAVVASGGF